MTSVGLVDSSHEEGEPGDAREDVQFIPEYGWKVALDHKFPEKRNQDFRPRLTQMKQLMPMAFRYIKYYIQIRASGRKPWIDPFAVEHGKQIYGVPLGGIGSGTVGRGFRGEFCRYQMTPGMYDHYTIAANTFIVTISGDKGLYQRVLAPNGVVKGRRLRAWRWRGAAAEDRYCGLYPRSWTVYDIKEQGIKLCVRQVSPVIPHEYKDSCLPVGVFVWTAVNSSGSTRSVSVTLTHTAGTGAPASTVGCCHSEVLSDISSNHTNSSSTSDSSTLTSSSSAAVMLHHRLRGTPVTYCVAVAKKEGVSVSWCSAFDPRGSGAEVWDALATTGDLECCSPTPASAGAGEGGRKRLGVAVCGRVSVLAGEQRSVVLALAWDVPDVCFRSAEHKHRRRYRRWFNGPAAAAALAGHALASWPRWEDAITAWQAPVLQDPELPAWFKSALFNELYFVSDGGSLWLDMPDDAALLPRDPRLEYGRFAYLEGHEYRMYNTYDVHFYASWALALLWPQLQRSLQCDVAAFTVAEDAAPRRFLYDGRKGVRKKPNTVPHDLGDPEDEPFVRINAYCVHDVGDWKDLNLKFVLQVFRDYKLLLDEENGFSCAPNTHNNSDKISKNSVTTAQNTQTVNKIVNDGDTKNEYKDSSEQSDSIDNDENQKNGDNNNTDLNKPRQSSNREATVTNVSTDAKNFRVSEDTCTPDNDGSSREISELLWYVTRMWPVCCAVMQRSFAHDTDADGLIENEGLPDQTFDSWVMHGPSAYCCSLWVAALRAMAVLAAVVGDEAEERRYAEACSRAAAAMEQKLWNGSYYLFDSCGSVHSKSVMADQLVGHWYLALAGDEAQVFGQERVRSVLKLVYNNNVLKFCGGKQGAVNGMMPDGRPDTYSVQSEEVWVGVTYALAATMIHEDMVEEGFHTAEGIYRTVYEQIGLGFETPEALFPRRHYRAIGYMRPLSIWSMWHAWQARKRRACQARAQAEDTAEKVAGAEVKETLTGVRVEVQAKSEGENVWATGKEAEVLEQSQ